MIYYWLAKMIGHLPQFRGQTRLIHLFYREGGKPKIQKIIKIKGTKKLIYADTNSHIGWSNLILGCYDQKSVRLMRILIKNRQNKVAIDVGANIGHYSLILSELFQQVYSFEPVEEFRIRFHKNLKINRLSNVEICPNALGDESKTAEMAVLVSLGEPQTALINTGGFKLHDAFKWEFQNTPVETLDSFIMLRNLQDLDYLKIDVDGSEREVLLGALKTLQKFKPIVQIELNEALETRTGTPLAKSASQILKSLGYSIMDVYGKATNSDCYNGNFFAVCEKSSGSSDIVRNRLNIEGATERIDPDREPAGIISIHLKRYEFSKHYCERKKVLDAACGVGYGSGYLASAAASVVGIDIDPEAILFAQKRYQTGAINFFEMDVTKTNFDDSEFDTICSFETIEHLSDIPAYLNEMSRLLRKDGTYLVSTPQVSKTNNAPQNPYHTVEFSRIDFETLLRVYFYDVEIYGQRRKESDLHYYLTRFLDLTHLRGRLPRFGKFRDSINKALKATTFDAMFLDDILITKEKISRASELIAVCKNPKKRNIN